MSSSFFILLLLLLAVVGVAGFVYWLMKRKKKHKHRVQSVRTIQVKPNESKTILLKLLTFCKIVQTLEC